jgi:hypothetical protein
VLSLAHRHHAGLVTLARQLADESGGEVNALGVRELTVDQAHLRRSGFVRAGTGVQPGAVAAAPSTSQTLTRRPTA